MNYNILSVKNIKKSFGGVNALKGVDLQIKKGEIHCLAGENGCGKSTLIKVISGFYTHDDGDIEIDGQNYPTITPSEAIKAGIQVIYQDFSIFPNLTVLENLALNQVISQKKKLVNKKEFRDIAEKAVRKINFEVDLDARVETLKVADKQLIAISRALLDDAKLVIMDEPTTALTKKEINNLFKIIENLKKNGVTILFVSHKLDEVFEISDSITILKNGENVISCPVSEMNEKKFAYYMTGREFAETNVSANTQMSDVIMEVSHLSASGFEDVSFKLRAGEILGISGQLGSGRTELALSLFGMLKPTSGEVKVDGKTVQINSVKKAQKLGIALVPEDRLTEGLFMPQSIKRNITVTRLNDFSNKLGFLKDQQIDSESLKWIKEIHITTENDELPASTLSGGNQQKVVVSRWLSNSPRIMILNGPTVGVDIGAKYDIHALLRNLAISGMAIIIVSNDASEVISTCNRVLVMHAGRIISELSGSDLSEKSLIEAFI